jgi:glucokinase
VSTDSLILVGDIGGTNARFGLMVHDGKRLTLAGVATLPSRQFDSFWAALTTFFEEVPEAKSCDVASFGLAGPVVGNRCEATNLPWVIDGAELAIRLGVSQVPLVNDLEAAAWGVGGIGPDGLVVLNSGRSEATGNRALIAPGTGLGEAALIWDGEKYFPFASEGGHADFAPSDELEIELLRFAQQRFGHVSWERLVSGPGLETIFRFYLERDGAEEPEWLRSATDDDSIPRFIRHHASDESCPSCGEAVDLFFKLLGAEAGNLALKTLATGGIYVAGGIVPRMKADLKGSRFLEAFYDKGRFRPLLEEIPVMLVAEHRIGLYGTARRALAAWPQDSVVRTSEAIP